MRCGHNDLPSGGVSAPGKGGGTTAYLIKWPEVNE